MNTRFHILLTTTLTLGAPMLGGCADDEDDPIEEDAMDTDDGETAETAETADSEDPTAGESDGETEGPQVDPFEGCSRDLLEEDLVVIDAMGMSGPIRWYGPGADPETGELLDDGTSTYVVSATYLALQPTPEAQQAFFSLLPALNEALFSNPGLVAVQLGDSQNCAVARTFTVWTDEQAMMDFVTSDAHVEAITQISTISRGGSVVTSWSDAGASEISWDGALVELGKVEPMY